MSTQQLSFNDLAKSGNASGFAVVFFLLGAPHIYSLLRQRSNRKSTFGVPKAAGWLITMLAGVLVLLAV
jgi:hypothetical protein